MPTKTEQQGGESTVQQRDNHFDLIRQGTQRRLERDAANAFRQEIEQVERWNALLREAINHRVDALFLNTVDNLCTDCLAAPLRNQLAAYRKNFEFHNAFLIEELRRIAQSLHRADIPAIFLKGPVLARHAYGDVNRRRYGDLDLFISRDQLGPVANVLREQGYVPYPRMQAHGRWKLRYWLFMYGQVPFTRGNGLLNVDVHTKLVPVGYSLPSTFSDYWLRAQPADLKAEAPIYRFAPEDLVLILCYHGLKNHWKALKYICDVAQLIEEQQDLDWTAVWRRARHARSERPLLLGLELARRLYSISLPAFLQRHIEQRRAVLDKAADLILGVLQRHTGNQEAAYGNRIWLQTAMCGTVATKLRYGTYSLLQHVWSDVVNM